MDYDVIVIGGSFAGLSSAYFLAKEGLKVCVFERRRIGEFTKSTGMLTQSVIDDLNLPKKFIENEINKAFLYTPNMIKHQYNFGKSLFFSSRTHNFLKWFKKQNKELGVDIKENINCKKIKLDEKVAICEGKEAKLIIFATGVLPNLQQFNKRKTNYYNGLEYVVDGIEIEDEHGWQVYFDYNTAPGYFSWILPINKRKAHIGLLKKSSEGDRTNICIKKLFKKIGSKPSKIYEVRAGIVPLSGPLTKTYGDRYTIIGDAAGQIGAFSSSGINYSIRIARATAKTIADNIEDPLENNLKNYEIIWKKEVGGLLKQEFLLRKLFDKINSNNKLEKLLELLNKSNKKRVARIMEKFSNMEGDILRDVFLLFT